jgi:hypothetical protein
MNRANGLQDLSMQRQCVDSAGDQYNDFPTRPINNRLTSDASQIEDFVNALHVTGN